MGIIGNNKVWILVGSVTLAILMVAYSYALKPPNSNPVQPVNDISNIVNKRVTDTEIEPSTEPTKESVPQSNMGGTQDILWYSERGQYEIDLWDESRGHFSQSDVATYKNYDFEALEALGQQGDVKALQALARKQLEANMPKDVVIETALRAAVGGSTHALLFAGLVAEPSKESNYSDDESARRYNEAALDSLALFEVSIMRGDRTVVPSMRSLIERHRLELSDADKDRIKQKAQSVYDDLVAQRKAMGLGDFDNSVPEFVTSSFDAKGEEYSIDGRFD